MIDDKLVIKDDKGKGIEVCHQYGGEVIGKSLDEIESCISKVKGDVLLASEHALLKEIQAEDIKKKVNWSRNGVKQVSIRTLHGEFTFANQRYKHKQTGQLSSFLDCSCYQSKGLREFYSYYAFVLPGDGEDARALVRW